MGFTGHRVHLAMGFIPAIILLRALTLHTTTSVGGDDIALQGQEKE